VNGLDKYQPHITSFLKQGSDDKYFQVLIDLIADSNYFPFTNGSFPMGCVLLGFQPNELLKGRSILNL